MPDRYTTQEAAEILGVNSSRVRQLVKQMDIEPEYFGKAMFLSREQIEQLKDRHDKRGPIPKVKE